ncbi:MAG: hypothetical protein KGL52_03480 [Rhodospirillales bacterium]|nr:hypothetical protein [Rhodospirillales bacterium]
MIVGRQPFSGFEQDLRDEIVRYLPYERTDSRLTGELAEMPTSELLSAGTTMAAARQASRLRHSLSHISKGIAADPDHLRPMIEASGHTYPRSPRFRLVFLRSPSRWEFAIREEVTGSLIGIAP